jgi:hypothetical protein
MNFLMIGKLCSNREHCIPGYFPQRYKDRRLQHMRVQHFPEHRNHPGGLLYLRLCLCAKTKMERCPCTSSSAVDTCCLRYGSPQFN